MDELVNWGEEERERERNKKGKEKKKKRPNERLSTPGTRRKERKKKANERNRAEREKTVGLARRLYGNTNGGCVWHRSA